MKKKLNVHTYKNKLLDIFHKNIDYCEHSISRQKFRLKIKCTCPRIKYGFCEKKFRISDVLTFYY